MKSTSNVPHILFGPMLALVAIIVLEAVRLSPWSAYAPFPISVLMIGIIISVFRGGVASGSITAAISNIYLPYFLIDSGAFASNPSDAWNRLLSWTICFPIIVGIVGSLKRSSVVSAALLEREKIAAEKRREADRARAMIESASAAIWAVDRDGVLIFLEGKALVDVGIAKDAGLGRSIFEIYGFYSEVAICTRRALRGERCEATILVNQIWFDYKFSPTFDSAGLPVGAVGVAVDVTARLESESAKMQVKALHESANLLRESELKASQIARQLQTLIDSSPVGILALDANRKLTVWNAACEKMFGWSSEEVLGGPLPFVPTEKKSESIGIMDRIESQRGPMRIESDRVRRDGSHIRTGIAAIPLFDDGGHQLVGYMAIMTDATERYQAQQQMIEANRILQAATQSKSEFLANMSHEIRTPLNGVIGMTGLILDTELTDEQLGFAHTIRDSAEMLLALINDILDFSKIEAGKLDVELIVFDLDFTVQNIERMLDETAKKKGLRLLRAASPDLKGARFIGDPTRLSQILVNLIGNAIKFTEQGQVVVDMKQELLSDGKTLLRIEVTDTGIGLSPDEITKIFQPFTQANETTSRRFGGTGLGLSICKRLTELMGGEIGATSREGQGSTFWFTIVVDAAPAAPMQFANVIDTAKPRKSLRILLAEDDSVNQMIAVTMLEKQGFRVDAVANGQEAIEILKSIPYDLVLMDCQMPVLDGYGATRQIRASNDPRLRDIPIVAMTANAMAGDRERCLAAGMHDYITKPIKAADLIAVVYRAVEPRPKNLRAIAS